MATTDMAIISTVARTSRINQVVALPRTDRRLKASVIQIPTNAWLKRPIRAEIVS